MLILILFSLLYYFHQVCHKRTGFPGFFLSSYSFVIFFIPFLAYIDGTFLPYIFTRENVTAIEFNDAMAGFSLVVGYFLALFFISFLRKPLPMQPTASKKVNSDKIRKAKYTEGQPIKIKKITSIDSSEVQVSESNSSEKNAENPFSLSEELDDNSSQREMEDKLDNE